MNKEKNLINIFSIVVLVSALIVSAAIFISGEEISGKITLLSEFKKTQVIPKDSKEILAPNPSPIPSVDSKGSIQMNELLENAAATLGNPNAPVIIVEFSDYQCPFCRSWFNNTKSQLDKDYVETGKVFFVYKDFPLSFHSMAQPYAEAARCSGEQEKYWEMHNKIFEEQAKFGQGTVSNLTVKDIKSWAKNLGLNSSEFDSCLDSKKYSKIVQANFNEGSNIGVSGTPSFFIGKKDGTGRLIVGAQPFETFKSAIDLLLS